MNPLELAFQSLKLTRKTKFHPKEGKKPSPMTLAPTRSVLH